MITWSFNSKSINNGYNELFTYMHAQIILNYKCGIIPPSIYHSKNSDKDSSQIIIDQEKLWIYHKKGTS